MLMLGSGCREIQTDLPIQMELHFLAGPDRKQILPAQGLGTPGVESLRVINTSIIFKLEGKADLNMK